MLLCSPHPGTWNPVPRGTRLKARSRWRSRLGRPGRAGLRPFAREPWPPRGALSQPSLAGEFLWINKSICSFGFLLFSLFFCPFLTLPQRSFCWNVSSPHFPFFPFVLLSRSLSASLLSLSFCISPLFCFGPFSASGVSRSLRLPSRALRWPWAGVTPLPGIVSPDPAAASSLVPSPGGPGQAGSGRLPRRRRCDLFASPGGVRC